jgi:hypothetical protein
MSIDILFEIYLYADQKEKPASAYPINYEFEPLG